MPDRQAKVSDAFIAQQRTRLEAMRLDLLVGEENTIANERASEEKNGDEAEEREDDAQELAQEDVNQSLHNVNYQRIGDIERALQKIDEGTYGFSDESGGSHTQGPTRGYAGGHLHHRGAGPQRRAQVTCRLHEHQQMHGSSPSCGLRSLGNFVQMGLQIVGAHCIAGQPSCRKDYRRHSRPLDRYTESRHDNGFRGGQRLKLFRV